MAQAIANRARTLKEEVEAIILLEYVVGYSRVCVMSEEVTALQDDTCIDHQL